MNWKKISILSIFASFLLPAVLALNPTWTDVLGPSFGKYMSYVFGDIPTLVVSSTSAVIITIAVWLLVFITFADIISTFSTFSKGVSWGAAFLIGVIAANLGIMTSIIAGFTGIFAGLGVAAVYVGLGAAFVAFIIVNLGLTKFGPWIMGRKAMMEAQKTRIDEEAGGTKLAGAIKGMKTAGKALADNS